MFYPITSLYQGPRGYTGPQGDQGRPGDTPSREVRGSCDRVGRCGQEIPC